MDFNECLWFPSGTLEKLIFEFRLETLLSKTPQGENFFASFSDLSSVRVTRQSYCKICISHLSNKVADLMKQTVKKPKTFRKLYSP